LSGLKKKAIEDFYKSIITDVKVYAQSEGVQNLVDELIEYHDSTHIGSSGSFDIRRESYRRIYDKHFEALRIFMENKGYYDIFVICKKHGHVMYTVSKESDWGENLSSGKLKNSGLAKVWKGAITNNDYSITDLERYAPSGDAPAQFIGHPILNNAGETSAVLVFQIPDALINEAYLLGTDKIMRSNSRFQEDAVLKTKVDSETAEKALNGQTGIEIVKDYRGIDVISAYNSIDIEGIDWAILTEINKEEAIQVAISLRNFILIIIVLIIIAVIIGSWLVARSIARPVEKVAGFAEIISNGDLTQTLEIVQNDEIGKMSKAMVKMAGKLKEVISVIITGSDNIASASEEISSSAQEMSQGTSEQASSVEEVSSTMEEIASNIQQNTDNAQETEQIAGISRQGIHEVSNRSQETVAANKQIAEKINIINEIAFQTNILALNAAVEAARAGEHGKGFAVVAAEVRKLSERSKLAADEIVGLAQNSLKLAESAGRKMEEILPEVEKTTQLVNEISSASQEQNNGVGQINNAVQQLNVITQQNAASSEELAGNSEEMAAQADQLKEIISFFKINNNGGGNDYLINKSNTLLASNNSLISNNKQENGNGKQKKEQVTIDMTENNIKDKEFERY